VQYTKGELLLEGIGGGRFARGYLRRFWLGICCNHFGLKGGALR
jgi:hypothetical protein